jgi:ribonuclease HI
VLYNVASKVCEGRRYLGCATNDVAEYTGLIHGLEVAKSLRVTHLEVRGDSQLVLSQVKGEWRCEKPHLKELCVRAQTLAASFRVCTFIHVLRARNLTQADALASRAMDSHADFEEMCPDGLGPEHDHSPGGKRARSPAPDERVAQRARRV